MQCVFDNILNKRNMFYNGRNISDYKSYQIFTINVNHMTDEMVFNIGGIVIYYRISLNMWQRYNK